MVFTMHSHSGQFCPGHAKDQLEEIVKRAVSLNMQLIALTEHMPRTSDEDLYPEEIEAGTDTTVLLPRHQAFIAEAARLRSKYASQIKVLVGFECEWIRAADKEFIITLSSDPAVDLFLGSVHHVHGIPIDFDRAMYERARAVSGGSDERLFCDFFDAQLEMMRELKPPVVAHFDLIRLFSDNPDRELRDMPRVWERVMRNLEFMRRKNLMLEVNSSALRKGLREPYPGRSICEEYLNLEGKFTLCDDSHGLSQVGLNFKRVQDYLLDIGIEELWYLDRDADGDLQDTSVLVEEMELDHYPATPVVNGV